MGFEIEAFQNRFLAPGQKRVDAILTVTSGPAGSNAGATSRGGPLVVGFIIDKSGSMAGDRIDSVKRAVGRAISMLEGDTRFFVVAFDSSAHVVVRETMATDSNKESAIRALERLGAQGGTAMSTGLAAAREIFGRAPNAIRQAVFLTDGKNESERPADVAQELARCERVFECDCWGVGTNWQVGEVQEIARALLGHASLIPEASGIDAAFGAAMSKASAKALKDVRLRLWTPQGAKIAFVKQVNPTIEELTAKGRAATPQIFEYMTGSWKAGESRDFHVAIDVRPGKVNDEMLAARPSVVYLVMSPGSPSGATSASGWVEHEDKAPEARLFATWTADDSLSSRIDHHVAHYTGQDELASAIERGLELREAGKNLAATQLLGRAVKIAYASKNAEMTQRLARVVEVVDAGTGTVRLKKDVKKAATMELQLESRTTKRVARDSAAAHPGAPSGQAGSDDGHSSGGGG